MNRSEVLAAFNRQVRQSTSPHGTGARFETHPHVIRRIAQPGLGGSGVLWTSLNAANVDQVIAGEVRFFGDRGERFEWKLYSYDEPADLPDRLAVAGFVPEEPESLMIAPIAEIIAELRSAELPPGVTLDRPADEAGVDRLTRV